MQIFSLCMSPRTYLSSRVFLLFHRYLGPLFFPPFLSVEKWRKL